MQQSSADTPLNLLTIRNQDNFLYISSDAIRYQGNRKNRPFSIKINLPSPTGWLKIKSTSKSKTQIKWRHLVKTGFKSDCVDVTTKNIWIGFPWDAFSSRWPVSQMHLAIFHVVFFAHIQKPLFVDNATRANNRSSRKFCTIHFFL